MPKALHDTANITCPNCYATTNQRCIESKRRQNGVKRRRIVCKECDHRYTSFSEDVSLKKVSKVSKRCLDESQVWLILSSTERHVDLAKQYGVGTDVIARIRKGTRYVDIYKKFHGLTNDDLNGCTKCHFWEDRCTFGFPEAGGTFAFECTLFQSKQ